MTEIAISGKKEDGDDILLMHRNQVQVRISRRGFEYKGKLIEDPHDAYERFVRWLGLAEEEVAEKVAENHQVGVGTDGAFDVGELVEQREPNDNTVVPFPTQSEGKKALLVIESSLTGDDEKPWVPLMPMDLPEWIKDPVVMGDMYHGAKVQHDDGGLWYRARRVEQNEAG